MCLFSHHVFSFLLLKTACDTLYVRVYVCGEPLCLRFSRPDNATMQKVGGLVTLRVTDIPSYAIFVCVFVLRPHCATDNLW